MTLYVLVFSAWTPYEKATIENQGIFDEDTMKEYKNSPQIITDLGCWAKDNDLTWHENIEFEFENYVLNSK